jgi:hypothetical protein
METSSGSPLSDGKDFGGEWRTRTRCLVLENSLVEGVKVRPRLVSVFDMERVRGISSLGRDGKGIRLVSFGDEISNITRL